MLRFLKGEMTQQQLGDGSYSTDCGSHRKRKILSYVRIANVFDVTLDEVFKYDPLNDQFKKKK